ncbi:PEP-CTERM sorting domain-containing protein [Methylomonas sp. LL1]|uniref:PEP-CTERM sorting domain-containing protein n=1 Tax=Methylomonas sp. LL1 TaxID=2785785 RepID=UPI0018C373C7|nr:PEP-CTERM sorting domain-containing protein [Methylomonas sp. LL1]QPK62815.1 PEP-CTERM sorting domain-containing protein [Methylomonas sp. LL1]
MKQIECKTYLKAAALAAGLAWGGFSSAAGLTNGDFSSNFDGWRGDVTSAGPISPLPGAFGNNFDASSGAAVLSTSFDSDGLNYSVNLFQTFDLSSNALTLNFDYSWLADDADDTWLAQLVDASDSSHFLVFNSANTSGNGQFNLAGFSGLTVQLLFGLENIGGADDSLTIDNIVITERQPNASVPEPGTLLLISAGLLAARRKSA